MHQLDCFWRRQRDSNPRGLAPKRFSRPPRYDHFDMPPYELVNRRAWRSGSVALASESASQYSAKPKYASV